MEKPEKFGGNNAPLAGKLNRNFGRTISNVLGDGQSIVVSRSGDEVTVRLVVENLVPLIPKAPVYPTNAKTLYTESGGNPVFDNETAQTATWDYPTDQKSYNGFNIIVQTRTAYNDAGDKKLYGFYRIMTFDKFGRLYGVSAETRVEIDAAGACA